MSYPATQKLTADVLGADGRTAFNCVVKDGKIIPALAPKKVADIVFYDGATVKFCESLNKFVALVGGNVYVFEGESFVKSEISLTAKQPFFVDIAGDSYAVGDDGCVRISESGLSYLPYAGRVRSGVLKNGRIFGADLFDGGKIKWSGAGGVDDWQDGISGAGWVRLKGDLGDIVDLFVYGGDLVALCDYGVAILSAYGTPENFKQTYMGVNLEKIVKNTAAIAAEKLVFCSGNKVLVCDKSEINPLEHEYENDFYSPVCAASSGDWYFVSGKSKKLGQGVTLCANVANGGSYYIDSAPTSMCSRSNIWGFTGKNATKFDGGEYTFISGDIDFGTPRRKLLKSIHLGNGDCVDVEVTNGVKTRILRGVKGYCRIDMSGKAFKITVQGSCVIGGIQAVAEVVSEI